jgi:hypothetical protein
MIIYNQAFDLYHSIHRLLLFLNRIEEGSLIEVERIRIWDFYLLFPNQVHTIRLKQTDDEIRRFRRELIRKTKNPYDEIPDNRKVFEKIRPYQVAALNCIASYGVIDKDSLQHDKISVINKSHLSDYINHIGEISDKDNNIILLMTTYYFDINLTGADGLKDRTNLIESKYDA